MTNKENKFIKTTLIMLLTALFLSSCAGNSSSYDSSKASSKKGNDYNGDGFYGGYDEFMGDSSTSEDGVYIDNRKNMHILPSNTQSLGVILKKYKNKNFGAIYYDGGIFKPSEYKKLSAKLLNKIK